MSYTTLTFEPKIDIKPNPQTILWKGQVSAPQNHKSIMITLLEDIIVLNNRRTLSLWSQILKENNFEYEINFEHDYCKEYVIRDSDCLSYSLQLFACDLIEGQNKLELISISKTDATNLVLINNLKILQKLVLVCIDYEVDIKCTIEART